MQGAWTVAVKAKNATYPQRFVVTGAAAGNGIHAGDVGAVPVVVYGAGWAITIEHHAPSGWKPSRMQLKFPTATATEYRVDIQSDDAGSAGDGDFDDLVLTCAMAKTASDFLVYGNVSYYGSGCSFNPCARRYIIIDTYAGLHEALLYPALRKPLELLYPDRLAERVPPVGPVPPRPPFRPMVIPLADETAIPPKRAQVLTTRAAAATEVAKATAQVERAATVVSGRSVEYPHAMAKVAAYDRVALASLVDIRYRICERGPLPGVVLRFQEYDRTAAELAGGAYSAAGDRENLGAAATDMNGNYVFRFTRDSSDVVQEVLEDVAVGENSYVQSQPDVVVQVLDPASPVGYCYESAPYWNVPLMRRVDICVPKSAIGRLPTACQGSDAIQAIGNIMLGPRHADGSRTSYSNYLGASGRITARNTLAGVPQVSCAVWGGYLDLFACFLDQDVTHYTIRWQRDGAGPTFFREAYSHPKIANINVPNYSGDPVGPFDTMLHVDGAATAIKVPAYLNIESDPAWVFTHRDRKAVIGSANYAPPALPGPVRFQIDGYDAAGNPVASDHLYLYIDNSAPDVDIDSVEMGAQDGGDCALFELDPAHLDAPLTVRFKAKHGAVVAPALDSGFFGSYGLSVQKGNIGGVTLTAVNLPGDPSALIAAEYVHGDNLACNTFDGTLDDALVDGTGYVRIHMKPAAGGWLDPGQAFCTFAVGLGGSVRVTNGYSGYGDYWAQQYLLGIQQGVAGDGA